MPERTDRPKPRALNGKDVKHLRGLLESCYGFSGELPYVFVMLGKEKVFMLSRAAGEYPYERLRVDAMGLYFGAYMPGDEFRLSVEGSQLIGPSCAKNVLELTDAEMHLWVRGESLEKATELRGFLILAHKESRTGKIDYLGCGKVVKKPRADSAPITTILNYVPKTRYVHGEEF